MGWLKVKIVFIPHSLAYLSDSIVVSSENVN
jgi:hypothetical protein